MNNLHPLKNFNHDIPASIVVFLVALPLCLGIALASGAPLYSGLIAGIVGGIVVASLSGSPIGVSGPAAGLAVIVLDAIQDLGAFELFLVAVVLAGVIQIIMGFAKGGIIAYYFPSSVIMGMLSGIGVIIFIKQIPHAFGLDQSPEGEFGLFEGKVSTFSELGNIFEYVSPGALIITVVSLGILLLWETSFMKEKRIFQLIPGPLIAVLCGVALNLLFASSSGYTLRPDQLVSVPVAESMGGFFSNFTLPDFSALSNPQIYITALVIAVVASLETLLCVEATDKLDPFKRVTPTNLELKAQGVGNIISGLIGGLPVTQVIVRSSANIQSGGRTKASAIIHGFLLLGSVIAIPYLLNLIPLATLAAILFLVGYKLAKPAVFKKMYKQGKGQFVPFIATVLGIVFTDLLIGLTIGLIIAIFYILFNNFQISHHFNRHEEDGQANIRIDLAQELTFINKATILQTLSDIPDNSKVFIDASNTRYMHYDIFEIIEDFEKSAESRNIDLTIKNLREPADEKGPSHITITEDGQSDQPGMEDVPYRKETLREDKE
jgi:MFS superfamily sulfate permease-like transporter